MLYQGNGKNLSTKETIVESQDCPKILGSPVTCGSQRANCRFFLKRCLYALFFLCFFSCNSMPHRATMHGVKAKFVYIYIYRAYMSLGLLL